jgi:hypothetical protein
VLGLARFRARIKCNTTAYHQCTIQSTLRLLTHAITRCVDRNERCTSAALTFYGVVQYVLYQNQEKNGAINAVAMPTYRDSLTKKLAQ